MNFKMKGEKKQKAPLATPKIRFFTVERNNEAIPEIIEVMRKVNTSSRDAKLNETSISNNNGSRIELNQDKFIKK